MKHLVQLADRAVVLITRAGVISGMVTLFVLLMIRIVARATETPFVAFDEIGELATVWMIMLGVIAMWRTGSLYRVDFLGGQSGRAAHALNTFVQLSMLFFAVILVWQGGKFAMMNNETSAFLRIDMNYYYAAMPMSGVIMAAYSIRSVFLHLGAFVTGRPVESETVDPAIARSANQL